ncbi:MAG: glutaredoxin family protein [Pseudomonadales bacterium]|nr:glutaredoxin family protein [Pseudomonadales bacterium]
MKAFVLIVGILIGVFWSQIYTVSETIYNEVMNAGNEVVAIAQAPPKPVSKKSGQAKPVIMYATAWCTYCKKAREYFARYKIEYTEYDIEKDEQAKRMYELMGGGGVPLLLVDGQKIRGFNLAKLNSALR